MLSAKVVRNCAQILTNALDVKALLSMYRGQVFRLGLCIQSTRLHVSSRFARDSLLHSFEKPTIERCKASTLFDI